MSIDVHEEVSKTAAAVGAKLTAAEIDLRDMLTRAVQHAHLHGINLISAFKFEGGGACVLSVGRPSKIFELLEMSARRMLESEIRRRTSQAQPVGTCVMEVPNVEH
jgi:hypothetical protein